MSEEKEEPTRHFIFVYGTLKTGFPNSSQMPWCRLIGPAETVSPYPLVIDTDMHVPFLLDLPNHCGSRRVRGELYSADSRTVVDLDRFEGVGNGFYRRGVIPVEVCERGAAERAGFLGTAMVYFRDSSNGGPPWAIKWTVQKLLTLPSVSEYTPQHASRYVLRRTRKQFYSRDLR